MHVTSHVHFPKEYNIIFNIISFLFRNGTHDYLVTYFYHLILNLGKAQLPIVYYIWYIKRTFTTHVRTLKVKIDLFVYTICLTNGLTSATATIVEVGYRVDNFSGFQFVAKNKLLKKNFLKKYSKKYLQIALAKLYKIDQICKLDCPREWT